MNFSGFLNHDDDRSPGGETVGGGNYFFSPAAAMSGGPVQSIFSSPRLSLGLVRSLTFFFLRFDYFS